MLRKLQIVLMALMLTTVLGAQVFAETTRSADPYANPPGTRAGYTNQTTDGNVYRNTGARDGVRTRAADAPPRRGVDLGWLGLLGLAGLAGARNRNKNPQPNR